MVDLYKAIHRVGVCHYDFAMRHILATKYRLGEGKLMLIDFDGAVSDCTEEGKEDEMALVYDELRLDMVRPFSCPFWSS